MKPRTYEEALADANARMAAGRPDAPKKKDRSKANRGADWEAILKAQHHLYRHQGLADIVKIANPLVPMSSPAARTPAQVVRYGRGGPLVIARFSKGKHTDFEGILRGGRAVRLEAKRASVDRIDIGAVDSHQASALRQCDKLGGFAAVLVMLPAGMWLIPWLHWTPSGTKKSLNPTDLDERGIRFHGQEAVRAVMSGASSDADWLAAARHMEWI